MTANPKSTLGRGKSHKCFKIFDEYCRVGGIAAVLSNIVVSWIYLRHFFFPTFPLEKLLRE